MRKFVPALASALAFISIAPAVHAVPFDTFWTGAFTADWRNEDNWVGGVPTTDARAFFNSGQPFAVVRGSTSVSVSGMSVGSEVSVSQAAGLNLVGASINTSVVRSGGELRAEQFSSIFVSTFHSLAIDSGGTLNVVDDARFVTNANSDGVNFNQTNLIAGAQLNVRNSAVMENRGDLENRAGGVITLSSAAFGANIGAGADFTNAGTMHVQSSAGFNNGANTRFFQQGTLNINAGSQFVNAGGATFSHTGGTLNVTANGTFDMQGGNVTLSGGTTNISTGGRMLAGANSLSLNGGTLNVSDQGTMTVSSNLTQNNGSHVVHNNGQFTNNGSHNLNGGNFTVVGGGTATNNTANFTGNGGSLFVLGGGTLNGTGSYTQNSGSMQIDGAMAQTDVTINGGTVTGGGTITGAVTVNGGTVGLGNSPGLLTVNGDVSLTGGATLAIELGGLVVDTGYDRLDVFGTTTIDDGAIFDIDFFGAFTAGLGDSFDVLVADDIAPVDLTSLLFDFTDATLGAGLIWETALVDFGGGREALQLMVAAAQTEVSEPAGLTIFGVSLLGLACMRRKRTA
jgi:hypothetical protein